MWGKARSRARNWATTGIHRTGTSIRQILLGAFTASFSYWLAGVLWGHAMPFFAAITAFLLIGFTLETKVRKSLELSFGILTGITLGEIAHVTIGPGAWQLFITLMIAVTLARFANSGIVFTIQVAIQSMIVLLMPVTPGMTPGGRALDALDRACDEQAHVIHTCKMQVRCQGSGCALWLSRCRWGAVTQLRCPSFREGLRPAVPVLGREFGRFSKISNIMVGNRITAPTRLIPFGRNFEYLRR